MKFFRIILLTLMIAAPGLQAQSPPVDGAVLSVEDAIRIALGNNHRIRIARINAEIARNNTVRGTAGFLPTLDAIGSLSLASSDQESNSPFSFGNSETRSGAAQLALSWTVFDGFRMFAEDRRYEELSALGESQARSTIEQTVVSVVRAYLQSVQQAQLLFVLREALSISRLRYGKAMIRHELGGSTTELLNAQIAFHNDSSAVLVQELSVAIANREINLLLGRAAETPLRVDVALEVPPSSLTLEDMLAMARDRNADLRSARQNLRVAESSIAASRSSYFPRLSIFANYGYTDRLVASANPNFTDDISTQGADASVGLNLSFNLFNGFRNAADVENAALEHRATMLALEETRQRLEALVREQYLTLQTRLRTVDLERINLEAARRNLQLQLERYETGTVSSLEFRDAQLQAVRAETAVIVARFQARISQLELQRLTGEIII